VTVPAWQTANGWQSIAEITRGGDVLVFDPPDIIFINGGEQVRVVDHLTDRPVLEVMRIQRDAKGVNVISRYPMRVQAKAAAR